MRQKINIRYFIPLYIGFLLVFSSISLHEYTRLWKGVLIIALYVLFDLLWTYIRDRVWYLPLSSVISGLVLSVVAVPSPTYWLVVLLPLLAVISKQVFTFGKIRHVFNPASFAMGVSTFFIPSISWWGVAWGPTPLYIALGAGIFILWSLRRFHITIPFFLSYALFLSLLFLKNGVPVEHILSILRPQILDGTVIFFSTVMLIEPVTSSFSTQNQRIIYGVLVGFFAVLATYLGGIIQLDDPLIYGLLAGNLLASLIFLSSKPTMRASPATTSV